MALEGKMWASQNRQSPLQVRCSSHERKVQFLSEPSSTANMSRNRVVPVQFGK